MFNSDVRDGYWYHAGVVEAMIGAAAQTGKPLAIVSNTDHRRRQKRRATRRSRHPLIKRTQAALKAVAATSAQRDRVRREAPASHLDETVVAHWRAATAIARDGRGSGLDMLEAFGLEVPQRTIVTSAADAVEAARSAEGAVALKTAESHAQNRVGGVRLGLLGDVAVRAAYEDFSVGALGPRVVWLSPPMAPE